jgi:hypothetical protein
MRDCNNFGKQYDSMITDIIHRNNHSLDYIRSCMFRTIVYYALVFADVKFSDVTM